MTAASMLLDWLLHLPRSPLDEMKSQSAGEIRSWDEMKSWTMRRPLPEAWRRTVERLTPAAIDRAVLAAVIEKEPDPVAVDHATGRRRGGDPHRAFVGEPTSRASFGTFHEPIARLLDDEPYVRGLVLDLTDRIRAALREHDTNGRGDLQRESANVGADDAHRDNSAEADEERQRVAFAHLQACIDDGRPVIVWMTLELRPPRVTDEWEDCREEDTAEGEGDDVRKEGKSRRLIRWTSPEHCALLVGYGPDVVFINDPHTGRRERYDRRLFLRRWLHMGAQAVTLRPFPSP